MKLFRQALEDRFCLLDLEAEDIQSVFHSVRDLLVERGVLDPQRQDEAFAGLDSRERLGSTAIGHSVAVPHAYLECFQRQVIVLVRLSHGINLGAPDGIPTRFLFVLVGPEQDAAAHVDSLMNVARLMADDEFRYEAGIAKDQHELVAALDRFERRTGPVTVEARPVTYEALQRTGRLWGGVVADWKRRLPWYKDDFLEGLHPKAISSTLFLFFACFAPAVTFGGFMAEYTGDSIGVVEMIVGTAITGIIYALFAGQPLIILGGTGPLLVFTIVLYQLTQWFQIPFLETRSCVGLWTGLILLVLAATDASWLMRFFTRFTDEIFAALISIIFIVAAIGKLVDVFQDPDAGHDQALLTLLLALGTYFLATSLSGIRRSRYLLPQMREFLSDFGPAIALGSMSLIAYFYINEVKLPALHVPDTFRPTLERDWFVNPLDTPRWVAWASIGPALLVAVLVFIDQNITARLVNQADHKLHKGPAYHHDLALMGLLIALCSLFGLPWLVAATVRSLNHVRSLATVEEVVTRYGDTRERIIHVRENRVSALAIHLLIASSLFLLPLLQLVPMATLYGLFLFMGVVSMSGNQFFERLSLWIMDASLYPSTHYIRRVRRSTIHKYTLVQLFGLLACLAILSGGEHNHIAIFFPVLIALLVPLRMLLTRYFSHEDLAALDAEEVPDDDHD